MTELITLAIIVFIIWLIIKYIKVILCIGGVILVVWAIPKLIAKLGEAKRRGVDNFLRELYNRSSGLSEKVATTIMDALETDNLRQGIKSYIHWEILNTDINNRRALIKPRNRNDFTALVGRDLHNNQPFLVFLPPDIQTTQQAMAWLGYLEAWDSNETIEG